MQIYKKIIQLGKIEKVKKEKCKEIKTRKYKIRRKVDSPLPPDKCKTISVT